MNPNKFILVHMFESDGRPILSSEPKDYLLEVKRIANAKQFSEYTKVSIVNYPEKDGTSTIWNGFVKETVQELYKMIKEAENPSYSVI